MEWKLYTVYIWGLGKYPDSENGDHNVVGIYADTWTLA